MDIQLSEKISALNSFLNEMERGLNSLRDTQQHTKQLIAQFQDGGRLIGFQSLADVPPHSSLQVTAGVIAYRVPIAGPGRLAFVTQFAPGALLPTHHHDCIEIIHLLSGDLSDQAQGSDIAHTATYEPLAPHQLYSAGGCLLMAYFEK